MAPRLGLLMVIVAVESLTALALTTVTATSMSKIEGMDIMEFFATPSNWPKVVATSNGVEDLDHSHPHKTRTSPMKIGSRIKESLGIGNLDFFTVSWTCVESTPNTLVVRSEDGVPGVAEDCTIRFDVNDHDVTLTVEYNPVSPLGTLAGPILAIDNWLTLNILLPSALDPSPLDSFRELIGGLYGIAGILHLADLLVGPSALLTAAGLPTYPNLSTEAQAYAILWCAAGPISFSASRSGRGLIADLGIAFYGIVEVFGAYLTTNADALFNAMAVQGIVLMAWLYSSKKQR